MELIERNKNLMKKFETMINTADDKIVDELIANDATFLTPASPEPICFSNVQWHIKDMVADNEKVAVNWTLTGTHDGEFMGAKATGKNISVSFMNFYYINENGKFTKDIAAEGMIGIFLQLGLLK